MPDPTPVLVVLTVVSVIVAVTIHLSETVNLSRRRAAVRRTMNPARVRLLLLSILVLVVCVIATLVDGMSRTTAPSPASSTVTVPSTLPPTTVPPVTRPPDTVTVTTTVETVPTVEFVGRCEWWRPVLLWVGFPEWELETADRILYAESRCDNTAVNMGDWGGGSWCAFQIHRPSHEARLIAEGVIAEWDDLVEDPFKCAAAALTVYQRAGNSWSPWSTY